MPIGIASTKWRTVSSRGKVIYLPNPNYRRGMRWEDRAAEDLTALGYWVIQTRGSRTPTDLVGLKNKHPVILAQIKSPGVSIDGHGWNALYELAELCGATALVCDWEGRPLAPVWFRIVDFHTPRGKFWPREAWNETS